MGKRLRGIWLTFILKPLNQNDIILGNERKQCANVYVYFEQGFSFPSEAGYALDSKQAKFYMMETHYNNPHNSADSIKSTTRQKADNSGLKLYYTNNLRKYDAGVLSIGMFV